MKLYVTSLWFTSLCLITIGLVLFPLLAPPKLLTLFEGSIVAIILHLIAFGTIITDYRLNKYLKLTKNDINKTRSIYILLFFRVCLLIIPAIFGLVMYYILGIAWYLSMPLIIISIILLCYYFPTHKRLESKYSART